MVIDTNGGRAEPCPGIEVLAAVTAALTDWPDARFWGNELGNLAVYRGLTDHAVLVGVIDLRAPSPTPGVGIAGAWRWDNFAPRPTGDPS